jgi:hypothetical protein
MSDEKYTEDISAVEGYLLIDLGVDVIFGEDEPNAFWEKDDESFVSIDTKQSKRLQLYSILHEAGHAIIRQREDYDKLYPYGRKHKNKSISRRVDVLREEVVAWNEGEMLAQKLSIILDYSLWHNFMKKHLFEYSKWIQDPTLYKEGKGSSLRLC